MTGIGIEFIHFKNREVFYKWVRETQTKNANGDWDRYRCDERGGMIVKTRNGRMAGWKDANYMHKEYPREEIIMMPSSPMDEWFSEANKYCNERDKSCS